MRQALVVLFLFPALLPTMLTAAEPIRSAHAQKTLEIYKHIVEIESSKNLGNVPEIANYLASELNAAGIPGDDIEVVALGETAALIARYRGDGRQR